MNPENMSSNRPEAGTPPELNSNAGRSASPSTALRVTPPMASKRTPAKKVLGAMMPPAPCATWWPLKVEEFLRSNSPDFDENFKSGSFR